MTWNTRATAFAWTVHEGRLLAVLHERLGAEVWEVPGGHLDHGETFEQAAARETREETGIAVHVQDLMATCVHEWAERRQRRLIMFFRAVPVEVEEPRACDVGIVRAEWVDPGGMTAESTSAFLHPLLGLAAGDADAPSHPIMFRAEHRKDASGRWRPYIL
ncbi:NUDIX hydrolase [Nocardioides sp. WL0053]|uniref:NUDIX hydrolase n=1 Tax=Nocardioides jiangsuensis TaxID=2866161 RepID=A0ABS7RFT9_9ACTN|nr:NUDIX hydrolase [Nocardioides jiangsuensis]MBY9073362.1 NUDIX hydrolase [Nocardioides jiangsuensis]